MIVASFDDKSVEYDDIVSIKNHHHIIGCQSYRTSIHHHFENLHCQTVRLEHFSSSIYCRPPVQYCFSICCCTCCPYQHKGSSCLCSKYSPVRAITEVESIVADGDAQSKDFLDVCLGHNSHDVGHNMKTFLMRYPLCSEHYYHHLIHGFVKSPVRFMDMHAC